MTAVDGLLWVVVGFAVYLAIDRLFPPRPMTPPTAIDPGHRDVHRIIGGSLAVLALVIAAALIHFAGAF